MPINIKVDPSKKLTIFTVNGELTADEITESIRSFYNTNPTLNALFNVNNASINAISSNQIRQIAELIQKLRGVREGGRTAIVATTDINYGLSRMLEAMADNPNQNPFVETRVFRDMKAASSWLQRTNNPDRKNKITSLDKS